MDIRLWLLKIEPVEAGLSGGLLSDVQKFDTGIGYDKINIKHPKQDETHNSPPQSLTGGLL